MIKKLIIITIIGISSIALFGQDTITRIGPCYSPNSNNLKPIFVFEGIPIKKIEKSIVSDYTDYIDSIHVQKEFVLNSKGKAKFYGIVKIYCNDSINTGLKYILKNTNYWIYNNPLARIEINGKIKKWNKKTINKLINLKPDDIKDINVIEKKNSEGLIKIKIT